MTISSQKSKNNAKTSNNDLTIGKILKPRGLSGEVKVQVLTNKPEAFSFVQGIEKISTSGGSAYIKFKNVNTVEAAEKLRGQLIKIPRELLPLDDDEVIAEDLIGFVVLGRMSCDENGTGTDNVTLKKLGTVRQVEEVGSSSVIDCGHFSFPYEDAFVIETNMTKKQIVIKAEMLDEEVVL